MKPLTLILGSLFAVGATAQTLSDPVSLSGGRVHAAGAAATNQAMTSKYGTGGQSAEETA